MKSVLNFMKTYMVTLICGVVAVVAVVIGTMGMFQDGVLKAMESEKGRTSVGQMSSLRASPKSEEIINREKARGEELKKQFGETVTVARQINKREPLMAGVFPKSDRRATPLKFKETYREEVKKLPSLLGAEELPSAADIAEEQNIIEEERATEREKRDETKVEGGRTPDAPEAAGGVISPDGGGAGVISPDGGGMVETGRRGTNRFGGATGDFGGAMAAPSGPVTDPKFDPAFRAFVTKAKSIRCYVDPATFHISPIRDITSEPTLEDMWYAQVGLWVQEDVCRAIADMNKLAAEAVKEGDPYVEQMPVKRVVSIVVNGYVTDGNALVSFPGATTAVDGGKTTPSFTGRVSNELYDVVRYTLSVVVDQRDTLRLIDFLTRANFSKCISANYQMVDHEGERRAGYFYGTAPVVRATLVFETYMLREIFDELKPEPVKLALSGKKE